MSDDTITRNWRVVKEGQDYRLRQVDHAEGEAPQIAHWQPGGFQREARGKDLPDLYENLLRGARREIEEALERGVIEL